MDYAGRDREGNLGRVDVASMTTSRVDETGRELLVQDVEGLDGLEVLGKVLNPGADVDAGVGQGHGDQERDRRGCGNPGWRITSMGVLPKKPSRWLLAFISSGSRSQLMRSPRRLRTAGQQVRATATAATTGAAMAMPANMLAGTMMSRQGDDDGDAREEHRAAGGVAGRDDCIDLLLARGTLLSEAFDDEERVSRCRPARPIIVIMLMVELSMPMNWLMTAVIPIETRMPSRAG